MKNAYAEASAAASGADHHPGAYGMCAANGCCLPGTMSASTQGTNDWLCRLHFGAPRSEHDAITARIHNRADLFKAAFWLINRGTGEHLSSKIKDRIRAMGRADLVTFKGMQSCYGLGNNILQVLGKECREPQQHMGVPKSAAQGATWIDGDDAKEHAA